MRLVPLFTPLLCLTLSTVAWAQAPAPAPVPAPASAATAPAPPPETASADTPTPAWSTALAAAPDVAVQQRKYRMNVELSLGAALLPADAYSKEGGGVIAITRHSSDRLAWEIVHVHGYLDWRSGLRQQLEQDAGVVPQRFEIIRAAVDSNVLWSPVYAKFNLLNYGLVHLQPLFVAGGGLALLTGGDPDVGSTDPGRGLHYAALVDVGLGLRLWLSPRWSLRYDLREYLAIDLSKGTLSWPLFMSLSASVSLGGAK